MTDVVPGPEETLEPPAQAADTALEIPLDGDAAFASIMDIMDAGESTEEVPPGAAPADPAAPGDGQQPAAPEGAAAAGEPAAAPADGDGGESPLARDAGDYAANWGAALDGLESRLTTELTQTAVSEVREEYKDYISAVEQAPRYLVGKEVPRADGSEGREVLRDAQDARDWQEEIKKQLGREVSLRIEAGRTESNGLMSLVNDSIQLFQSNPDIVPNTRQFDRELADEFVALVQPFEIRNSAGKLVGWKADVKPLLASVRQQLAARRAAAATAAPAAPAAPTGPTAQQARAAAQPRNEQQQFAAAPQAGIPASAGQAGEEGEGLDALFGTLGFQPGTFRF